MNKKQVIIVTDGDSVAGKTVEKVGKQLNLRTISASIGNPTPIDGQTLIDYILEAKGEPVLVMVDDCGNPAYGQGEALIQHMANHPDLDILGAVAVASNAPGVEGVEVDCSIDCMANLVDVPVDKKGNPEAAGHKYVEGDTVDVLAQLDIPLIIGVGDIGKVKADHGKARATARAVQEILNRSGIS